LAHVKKLVSCSGGFGGARWDSLLCALVWTHDKVLFFVMSPNPTHDKVYKFCDYNKWMKIFKWISKITKNKHNTCIKKMNPNSNLNVTLPINVTLTPQTYETSSEMFQFISIVRDKIFEIHSIFLPKTLFMILWYIDKCHDLL
jgi:hypothetical protein